MTRWSLTLGAAALVALLPVGLDAQRRAREADTTLPVATDTIARHPETLFGKVVTVTAGVDAVVARGAFLVDQRRVVAPGAVAPVGAPLFVIAPRLSGAVAPLMQVAIKGQLLRLDEPALTRLVQEASLDASMSDLTRFVGKPVLVATSILTSTQAELVTQPAAPSTAPDHP